MPIDTKKILNTRIALRSDEYDNWYVKNPRLLPGEVAVSYELSGEGTEQKKVHFKLKVGALKVGQESKELYNYRELPFVEAAMDMQAFDSTQLTEDQLKTLAGQISGYLQISQKMDMSTFDAAALSASQISVLAQVLSSQMARQIDISELDGRIIDGMTDDQAASLADKIVDNMSENRVSSLTDKIVDNMQNGQLSTLIKKQIDYLSADMVEKRADNDYSVLLSALIDTQLSGASVDQIEWLGKLLNAYGKLSGVAGIDTVGQIVGSSESEEQKTAATVNLQKAMVQSLDEDNPTEETTNLISTMNKVVNTDTIEHGEQEWILNGGDCDDYNNDFGTGVSLTDTDSNT